MSKKQFYSPKIREIRLEGLQIKSIEKAELIAEALDVIEVEAGIGSISIRFVNMFVCPDIDWRDFDKTPMQRIVRRLCTE